jgi:hypothetical protein
VRVGSAPPLRPLWRTIRRPHGAAVGTGGFDAPPVFRQRDSSRHISTNTFAREAHHLCDAGARCRAIETQSPLRIDDAMPRHAGSVRQRAQRVAHQSRMPAKTGESRDRSIRGHASSWNLSYDRVNTLVRTARRYHTGAGVRDTLRRGCDAIDGRHARRSRINARVSSSSVPASSKRGGRTAAFPCPTSV